MSSDNCTRSTEEDTEGYRGATEILQGQLDLYQRDVEGGALNSLNLDFVIIII
jgi:hypothetical protein